MITWYIWHRNWWQKQPWLWWRSDRRLVVKGENGETRLSTTLADISRYSPCSRGFRLYQISLGIENIRSPWYCTLDNLPERALRDSSRCVFNNHYTLAERSYSRESSPQKSYLNISWCIIFAHPFAAFSKPTRISFSFLRVCSIGKGLVPSRRLLDAFWAPSGRPLVVYPHFVWMNIVYTASYRWSHLYGFQRDGFTETSCWDISKGATS